MQQPRAVFAEAIRRRAESPDNLEYLVQRSITALQLTKEQVLDLIARNPWARLDEMSQSEIEEYGRNGAKPLAEMPWNELCPHLYRLLAELQGSRTEVQILNKHFGFRSTLSHLDPTTTTESLDPLQRAAVLYLALMAEDKLEECLRQIPAIMAQLKSMVDDGLITLVITQMPEEDWPQVFAAVELPEAVPAKPSEEAMALAMARYQKRKTNKDFKNEQPTT
jgi:hypothetical protein